MNLGKFWPTVRAANKAYDRYHEPQRFIVGMAVMVPGFALIATDLQTHPVLFFGGVVYILVALALRTESRWRRQ